MLVNVTLNKNPIELPFGYVDVGLTLEAKLETKDFKKHGGLYLFQTKLNNYQTDIDYFKENNGHIDTLGNMLSVSHTNKQSIMLATEENTLYDILYMRDFPKCDTARLATGDYIPERLTSDEVKYIIMNRAGIDLKDAINIPTEVIYDPKGCKETNFEPIQGYKIGDAIFSMSNEDHFYMHLINVDDKNIKEKLLAEKLQF